MKNLNKIFATTALALTLLTLSSCGGSAGGGGAASCSVGNIISSGSGTDPTFVAAPTALKAVATGTANEVRISWDAVGTSTYTLYQTTDNLSGFENGNPDNLAAATPAPTCTDAGTATSTTIVLSDAATNYFLVTATDGTIQSFTSAAQTAATAHSFEFGTATGTASTVWMDRNLGAEQVATRGSDTMAYGSYYQFGRPADGHQVQTPTITGTLASSITPNHASFISSTGDWTAAGVDTDGALRGAIWSRIDGSGICPTGFKVPTEAELTAERDSWTSNNRAGAFASSLKWAVAGRRENTGLIVGVGVSGTYWTNSQNGIRYLFLTAGNAQFTSTSRSPGRSVRCIQN